VDAFPQVSSPKPHTHIYPVGLLGTSDQLLGTYTTHGKHNTLSPGFKPAIPTIEGSHIFEVDYVVTRTRSAGLYMDCGLVHLYTNCPV